MNRRRFLGSLGGMIVFARSARAAEFAFTQYHNQTAESPLHRHLVAMWDDVRRDTRGRIDTTVYPLNNNIAGSDPAALEMLVAGEIQFFTLMGGAIGAVVPVAEIQQMPFAFRSPEHAHRAMDGPLGAYLCAEMETKGIHGFRVGGFDNGMREMTLRTHAITSPEDLQGVKMRVPPARIISDALKAMGAEPTLITINGLYEALKTGAVDAQENPLAIVELFRLYEVVKYVSMTNHIWSGFNLIANGAAWKRIPADLQRAIERRLAAHVRLQRREQIALNNQLRASLTRRGLVFNDVDQMPFRRRLAPLYAGWKKEFGTKCWALLEAETGRLA